MPGIKDDDDHTDESFDGSVYGNPDTNLTDDEKEFLKANGCSCSKNDNNAEHRKKGKKSKAKDVDDDEEDEEEEERIEDKLIGMYHFRTMSDTREIYHYDENKGIYMGGAEIIISEGEHTPIETILMLANLKSSTCKTAY